MRLLLTLAAVAWLAACSKNTSDNTTGQAAPETGRVSPADTSRAGTPPATGTVDTTATGMQPDTAKGGFDTTRTTPPTTPSDTSLRNPTPPPDTSRLSPPSSTTDASGMGVKHDSM